MSEEVKELFNGQRFIPAVTTEATPLTEKEKVFCSQYFIKNFNITSAVIASGYSNKNAASKGGSLLNKPNVKKEIARLKKDLGATLGFSRVEAAKTLIRIVQFDVRKLVDDDGQLKRISELDDDTALAVQGIDFEERVEKGYDDEITIVRAKKVKVSDRLKAIDMLTKMFGYNEPEKMQIDFNNSSTQPVFNINVVNNTNITIATSEAEQEKMIHINDTKRD